MGTWSIDCYKVKSLPFFLHSLDIMADHDVTTVVDSTNDNKRKKIENR